MDIGIVIIIIVSIIGGGILFYLHQNKKINQINKVEENFQQIPEDKGIDWSITQHLGWLYKDGENKNFDNMNLYFNQSDASFFALSYNNEKIKLNVEMVKNGDNIKVNNENYIVNFSED